MEETYHVTFSEDDEAISKSSTEGDEINFNENRSFPDDEFLVPRSKVSQCSSNDDIFPYVPVHDPLSTNNIIIPDTVSLTDSPILQVSNSPHESPVFTMANDHPPISKVETSPSNISPSAEVFTNPPVPQDRCNNSQFQVSLDVLIVIVDEVVRSATAVYMPLPVDASPTTLSLGYIDDSEPIEHGSDEDLKMDPVDYPSNEEEEEEEEKDPLSPALSA
ncbi:hypothetical protein Tco_1006853 [Tanacetum coccineum]|uniref:Uncharacterized protein n=1 Tax=Tanacetum coccineum TaxID=301880 RepID=A0ABQ5FIX8_9ASTR